ncbi:MAG: hypothetical protein ACRYGG_20915 [Janthinobacterium lividum]
MNTFATIDAADLLARLRADADLGRLLAALADPDAYKANGPNWHAVARMTGITKVTIQPWRAYLLDQARLLAGDLDAGDVQRPATPVGPYRSVPPRPIGRGRG